MSTRALAAINSSTTLKCPFWAATYSAVVPSCTESVSHSSSYIVSKVTTDHKQHAQHWSPGEALWLRCVQLDTLTSSCTSTCAPASIRSSTHFRWPYKLANQRGDCPHCTCSTWTTCFETCDALTIDIRGRGIRNRARAHIHFCVITVLAPIIWKYVLYVYAWSEAV